jgi:hypothetical protein
MLEFVDARAPTSRLACQIKVSDALAGAEILVPGPA